MKLKQAVTNQAKTIKELNYVLSHGRQDLANSLRLTVQSYYRYLQAKPELRASRRPAKKTAGAS
jgi:hypothetical protein